MRLCSACRSSAAAGPPNRPARPGQAAEIHYGPSEDLEEIDVALIHEAAKQVDTAGYVLTDSAVTEALCAAAEHSVKVQIRRYASVAASGLLVFAAWSVFPQNAHVALNGICTIRRGSINNISLHAGVKDL
jgi:hypothetical protein